MRRLLLLLALLAASPAQAGWFFVTSTTSGGGTDCGSMGVAGQVCNSTGGSGAEWGQRIIGAPAEQIDIQTVDDDSPGDVVVSAGAALTGNTAGGGFFVTTGAGAGFRGGGDVEFTLGAGGDGASLGAQGGSFSVTAGDAASGSVGEGGDIFLTTGFGDGSSRHGRILLDAGSGNLSSAGNLSMFGGDQVILSGQWGTLEMTDPSNLSSYTGFDPNVSVVLQGGNLDGGDAMIAGDPDVWLLPSSNTDMSPITNHGRVMVVGHLATSDPGGIARTPKQNGTNCGNAGFAASGTDFAGNIAVGSTTTTTCQVTFGYAFTATPKMMMIKPRDATITGYVSSLSASGFTITFSADFSGKSFDYLVVE